MTMMALMPFAAAPLSWPAVDSSSGASKHTVLGIVDPESYGMLKSVIGTVTKQSVPLFEQTKAWEPRLDNGYPNVVYNPNNTASPWQLWYGTCGAVHSCSKQYLLYANSTDGMQWNKPGLNRYAFNGNKANNIVMYGGGLGIYRDEHETDPAKRFKISGGSPAGCYSDDGTSNCVVGTAASPDGINSWSAVTPLKWPKPWRPDCHTNLFYDPHPTAPEVHEAGAYIMTSRDYTPSTGRDIAVAFSGKGAPTPPPVKYGNWTKVCDNEYPPTIGIGGWVIYFYFIHPDD